MGKILGITVTTGLAFLIVATSVGCAPQATPAPTTPAATPAPTTPNTTPAPAVNTTAATAPVVPQVPMTLSFISSQPRSVSVVRNSTEKIIITAIYTGTGTAAGKSQDVTNSATYQSSNTSIATVATGGQITGVAAGSATITVTYAEGGISKTVTVTVTVTAA